MRLNKKASAEGVSPAPVPNGDRPQLEVNDYRQLFESIDQGFCVIEVIFDDSDQPIDYRFLDVNPAFEHQTGLRGANGSLMRDLAPDHEDHRFEIYGRIAKTGTPEWFTNEARQLGRWFDVYAFRVGEPSANRVAVLFNDITERRGVEELSRQAAERDRFRSNLADATRVRTDPVEIDWIEAQTTRVLGEQLGASRTMWLEVVDGYGIISADHVDGVSSLAPGRYRLNDFGPTFGEQLTSGRSLVINDVETAGLTEVERSTYGDISTRALLAVPLIRDGLLVLALTVHDIQPRQWTEDEVALVEEAAARAWAIIGRSRAEIALNASEQRLRLAIGAADMYTWEIDPALGSFQAGENAPRQMSIPLPGSLEEAWGAVHPDDLDTLRTAFEEAIASTGEFQCEYRLKTPPGVSEVWAFSAGKAIPSVGLTPLRVVGITQNITTRKRAEETLRQQQATESEARRRAELLAEVSSELESVDGFNAKARRLVELLVPDLASFASVRMPDQAADVASFGQGENLIQLPLTVGLNLTGTLTLGFDRDRVISSAELLLAREVAERSSLLLSNARFQEEEHRIARRLQRTLLPEGVVQRSEVAIAARYEAGSHGLEVGGDWYDSFSLPDGRIGLAVGDVVGTGLDAAAAMGRIRTALAALATQTDSPGRLLTQLDEFVSGPNGVDFATACYAILDPASGLLRYASAAHPPILLLSRTGESKWLEDGRSLPLGGGWEPERSESSLTLDPSSLLVFYSDGLIERRGESLNVGLDRLEQSVQSNFDAPVEELCELLVSELGRSADDDTAVMCVRLLSAADRRFVRSFPARPEELSQLRMAVREWMQERSIGEQQGFDLLLALGEACTNAIDHAYSDRSRGKVEVEVRQDGERVLVEVRDFGKWKPAVESVERMERGTSIIMQLSDNFRRTTSDDGTTVSFSMPGVSA
ncbi:hypothetical protein BH18ACT6_BH18ACT6_02110 [soil metagenome]